MGDECLRAGGVGVEMGDGRIGGAGGYCPSGKDPCLNQKDRQADPHYTEAQPGLCPETDRPNRRTGNTSSPSAWIPGSSLPPSPTPPTDLQVEMQ